MDKACITSDLVGSKDQSDRSAIQLQLEAALHRVNDALAGELVVPLSITLGDEWQGLTTDLAGALAVDARMRRELHPLRVRSGIGQGAVTTPVRETTARMDGPCFHRSRQAVSLAKKRKGSATVIVTGDARLDDFLNGVERLLHAIFDGWTAKQFASVMAYHDHRTETRAAESLGIAQPTLHKSLAGALGKQYLAVLRARGPFLRAFAESDGSFGA